MKDLNGQTCFVTGGARGIGLGIALSLAEHGGRLAIADRDTEALAAAHDVLAPLADVRTYPIDVVDRDGVAAVADRVEDDLGPVQALFNNAGIVDSVSPSMMRGEVWDWLIDVNLHGVYNCLQAFLPRMIERGEGGLVVNTASLSGLVASGSGFAYHASKFGVVGLTIALREEVAHHGISVSVVCPGLVATGIVNNTRQSRPEAAEPHSERVVRTLDAAQSNLLEHGVPIEVAGQRILEAALAGVPYIFTDDSWRPAIEAQTEQILASLTACFPDSTETEPASQGAAS